MPIVIPLASDEPRFTVRVSLSDRDYTLDFYWNERDSYYYMGIYDDQDNPIRLSIKCVLDFPLAQRTRDERMFPGILVFTDISGERRPAQYDLTLSKNDFMTRVLLMYYDVNEVREIAATLAPI